MREFHALLRWTKVWMRSVWVKSGQFPTARRTHRRHHARGTALGTTHIKEEKKNRKDALNRQSIHSFGPAMQIVVFDLFQTVIFTTTTD